MYACEFAYLQRVLNISLMQMAWDLVWLRASGIVCSMLQIFRGGARDPNDNYRHCSLWHTRVFIMNGPTEETIHQKKPSTMHPDSLFLPALSMWEFIGNKGTSNQAMKISEVSSLQGLSRKQNAFSGHGKGSKAQGILPSDEISTDSKHDDGHIGLTLI